MHADDGTDPAAAAASGTSLLELDGVVKRYRDGEELITAVAGVSLAVAAGELVAIYGPSGSGKTTLLLLAAGLLAPDTGVVRFDGVDLAGFSDAERTQHLRHDLGFVYQSAHLMGGVPALENAAIKLLADGIGLRRARGVAQGCLERLGLGHRLDHTPERLSGGERQRVAIARALIGQPRLILADEPTGNLDARRGSEILDLMVELAREEHVAVLLVTHDPQAAALADRVFVLRDGKPLEGVDSAVGASVLPER